MDKKIVSIALTIFMLIMCVGLTVTFRYVNMQKNLDLSTSRVEQSVLTTGGEVTTDSAITMSGAELATSIKYMYEIEERKGFKSNAFFSDETDTAGSKDTVIKVGTAEQFEKDTTDRFDKNTSSGAIKATLEEIREKDSYSVTYEIKKKHDNTTYAAIEVLVEAKEI